MDWLQATGTLKLTANIGLDFGTAGYDLYAEFMDIGLGASASATLEGLTLYMEGQMCISAGCSVQVTISERHPHISKGQYYKSEIVIVKINFTTHPQRPVL
jgi:hypothetical protein